MCLNKTKLDSEPYSVTAYLTFAIEVYYSCTWHFILGTLYSYKTTRTCSELRSVEHRLSFAVEVTTASGHWKHPLPLKIIFSAISNGYYVLEMADT